MAAPDRLQETRDLRVCLRGVQPHLGARPADRRRLVEELEQESFPGIDGVVADDVIDILREAVLARNGWKHILERSSVPRKPRRNSTAGTLLAV